MGRDLQKEAGQCPQVIITTPILEGTDGVEKMSKSYDNYIGITDSPSEQYGRTLSIPDELIGRYFEYATDIDSKELYDIHENIKGGTSSPRDLKRYLARKIVSLYHNEEDALQAERAFDALFIAKDEPDDMPEYKLESQEKLVAIIVKNKMAGSNGEARRLISQGGVKINNEKVDDMHTMLNAGEEYVLKVGKRKFLRIKYE